ncbi:hypothetical protein [Streptosporangium sp. CA-115845]|uniref:hypothetical protein n=1 Tax=Streptosporangium sp. CA-115845 TaxID=3240071 RepID=UPI003D8E734B
MLNRRRPCSGPEWYAGDTGTGGFGNGGRRIYVAPAPGLAVAVTAGRYDRPDQDRPGRARRGDDEAILPGIES